MFTLKYKLLQVNFGNFQVLAASIENFGTEKRSKITEILNCTRCGFSECIKAARVRSKWVRDMFTGKS